MAKKAKDSPVQTVVDPKSLESTETPEQGETPTVPANREAREIIEEQLKAEDAEVEDLLPDPDAEEVEEPAEEAVEDSPPLEEPIDEGEEEVAETEAEEPKLDDFLVDSDLEEKDGKQKRIDKLTASNYQKDEKINSLEDRLTKLEATSSDSSDKTYTKDQLKRALVKAREDGDIELELEIIDQMGEQKAKAVEAKYERQRRETEEKSNRQKTEWTTALEAFEHYGDSSNPELYDGSHRDLNIRSQKSLLYQLFAHLYMQQTEDAKKRYGNAGGITLAVSDALRLILNKKKGLKPKDSEKSKLKTQVKKERRKRTIGATKSSKAESAPPAKKKSQEDYVREEIQKRKKRVGKLSSF